MLEIVKMELISRHHDNSLAGYFGIKKTWELVVRKYYWRTLKADVKSYVKRYNICLALKVDKHKPFNNPQSLPIPTHWWKNLSMDFITGLPISLNWKGETYNLILVIINKLMKMVYYKPIKIIIYISGLAKVIIDVIVRYYSPSDSIIRNWSSVFISKFWSSLCYFFKIKQKLLIAFYLQTDG